MSTKTDDIDILARTLYGEAESGNREDAQAIAAVIVNRSRSGKWPSDISEVCLQPWQFSCWNSNDPNRQRILKAKGKWFEACKAIAKLACSGKLGSSAYGATHYYATFIPAPRWAKGRKPCHEVKHRNGNKHVFFNNVDRPVPKTAKEALDEKRPLGSTGTVKAARAGVGAALGVGAIAEQAEKLQPLLPFVYEIKEYAPWAIAAILGLALAYMLWRRIDDRNKGLR